MLWTPCCHMVGKSTILDFVCLSKRWAYIDGYTHTLFLVGKNFAWMMIQFTWKVKTLNAFFLEKLDQWDQIYPAKWEVTSSNSNLLWFQLVMSIKLQDAFSEDSTVCALNLHFSKLKTRQNIPGAFLVENVTYISVAQSSFFLAQTRQPILTIC